MSGIEYIDVERFPEGVESYFKWGTRVIRVTRFASDGAANNYGRANVALVGIYARAWLADPCSCALEEHIEARRQWESEADRIDRIARRRSREQLQREADEAKSKKPRRRDW